MTPYDKAKDLIRKCQAIHSDFDTARKFAALIVYEIIDYLTDGEQDSLYWQLVRKEIYASSNPLIDAEARADRFNEDLR
jgi:hypothetical protein